MQEEKKDTRPPVKVIATQAGYDGLKVRAEGETFHVPASMFDKRQRHTLDRDGVKKTDGFYDPPGWFEEAVDVEETVRKSTAKSKSTKGDDLA